MKIAYFDCIAGASGDMILGAMLDAGLSESALREGLAALKLRDFELRIQRVAKHAFSATKVDVLVADDVPERHLAEIETIVHHSALPAPIQKQAMTIFQRLCEAEANIHGTTPDNVHLHELGGVDTIVDVVGTLIGLDTLNIEEVYVSPLPLGRGSVHGAHGYIPLPAPATVALLCNHEGGVPIVGTDLQMETVTPTGAVLLTSLAKSFGPLPPMTLISVGYGAGTKDLPIPNILRLLVGTTDTATPSPPTPRHNSHAHHHHHGDTQVHHHPHAHEHPHTHSLTSDIQKLVMLETNIDDLNPEIYDYVMTLLFQAGALDVFLSPIQMKKNRPATLLHVLCKPEDVASLKKILFIETSTLGIRQHTLDRHALPRRTQEVKTIYGPVHVKIADLGEGQEKFAPEYEDCRRLAERHQFPLRCIYQAAERAATKAIKQAINR